ncbi:MAG: DUF3800 domain-containing protein [Hyphomicrobium sp.]|jgi:hypothetical protein
MSRDQDQKTFDIYVDETSKNSPFMGIGALFTRKDSARSIAHMIQETIDGFGDRPNRELHWTKLKNHQLPLYQAVALKLMACTQVKPYRMRFNALIVETSKIDRSVSEGANREVILSKFMFGLIFQMASNFGVNNQYRVFIDSPHGREECDVALQAMLNNRAFSRTGQRTNPFKVVRYVRSENSRLIQAADLLAGAIAYETNSLHLANQPAKHRLALWSAMLEASGYKTFAEPTRARLNRLQIMHFDFEKSAARRKFEKPPPPETDNQ